MNYCPCGATPLSVIEKQDCSSAPTCGRRCGKKLLCSTPGWLTYSNQEMLFQSFVVSSLIFMHCRRAAHLTVSTMYKIPYYAMP